MRSILLCGFMGCGKTTIGRMLADRTGFRFVDTDSMVASIAGRSIRDMLESGEVSLMRSWEHTACEMLAGEKNTVIATGGGVMTFESNAVLFKGSAYIVYIRRDFDLVYPVISRDPVRTLAYGRPYAEVRALADKRDSLYVRYADQIVTNDRAPLACVNEILRGYRRSRSGQ